MKEALNDARGPPPAAGVFVSSSPVTFIEILKIVGKLPAHIEYIKRLSSGKTTNDVKFSIEDWELGEEFILLHTDLVRLIWEFQYGGRKADDNIEDDLAKVEAFVMNTLPGLKEERDIEKIKPWLEIATIALAQLVIRNEELIRGYTDWSAKVYRRISERVQKEQARKLDEQGKKLDEQGKKLDEQGKKLDRIEGVFQKIHDIIRDIMARLKSLENAVSQLWTKVFGRKNCLIGGMRNEKVREKVEEKRKKLAEGGIKWILSKAKEVINNTADELGLVSEQIGIFTVSPEKELAKLPDEVTENSMIILREEGDNHAVRIRGVVKEGDRYYIIAQEDNVNGQTRFNRRIYLSEAIRFKGQIVIISYKEYRKYFERELSEEEIAELEADVLNREEVRGIGGQDGGGPTGPGGGGGPTGPGGGGGPTGPGGGGATGPGGRGPGGGGAGASSALGGDGIPRNNAEAMATTLPENNGVITGNNNIDKGNDGQASSAVTPNNILNLLPSAQYQGINYKGIAASPVINTGTGAAPPGKAINAFFASLASRIIVVEPTFNEAHTLAAVSSVINSQPVSEPTGDDNDSSASVFQQQTQGVSFAG